MGGLPSRIFPERHDRVPTGFVLAVPLENGEYRHEMVVINGQFFMLSTVVYSTYKSAARARQQFAPAVFGAPDILIIQFGRGPTSLL